MKGQLMTTTSRKLEVKPVESFGDDDLSIPSRAASDFDLD